MPVERPLLDVDAASRRPFGLVARGHGSPDLAGLSVVEVYVLWRLGHVAGVTFSTTEVAALLGLSHQRVSQVEAEALASLAQRPEVADLVQLLDDEPLDVPAVGALVA